jgi:hypothetical protein
MLSGETVMMMEAGGVLPPPSSLPLHAVSDNNDQRITKKFIF